LSRTKPPDSEGGEKTAFGGFPARLKVLGRGKGLIRGLRQADRPFASEEIVQEKKGESPSVTNNGKERKRPVGGCDGDRHWKTGKDADRSGKLHPCAMLPSNEPHKGKEEGILGGRLTMVPHKEQRQ